MEERIVSLIKELESSNEYECTLIGKDLCDSVWGNRIEVRDYVIDRLKEILESSKTEVK